VVDENIAVVTLNRPDKPNSQTPAMLDDLNGHLMTAADATAALQGGEEMAAEQAERYVRTPCDVRIQSLAGSGLASLSESGVPAMAGTPSPGFVQSTSSESASST